MTICVTKFMKEGKENSRLQKKTLNFRGSFKLKFSFWSFQNQIICQNVDIHEK